MSGKVYLLGTLSILAVSTSAYAQPVQPESGATEEEIVVSARRRDESIQDVPLVVNAVTSETVEKLNLRRFEEIAAVVPGLRLESGGAIGASTSLRGVKHDTLATGNNGTVAFYLNDAPVMPDVIYQTLFDIGQIEVLRGPQGTLRGLATPSGSITLTTRTPNLREVGGYANGTFSSGSAVNVNGALNVPVIEDVLGIRIAGVVADGDGDRIRSINSSIDPHNETQALRASALFEPADFFKAGFTYLGMRAKDTRFQAVQSFSLINPAAVPSARANDYGIIEAKDGVAISVRPNTQDKDIKFYTWNAQLSGFGQKLIYVGSQQDYFVKSTQNQDYSNFFPTLVDEQATDTTVEQRSHEVRLQNEDRVVGMFDYVLGYFDYRGSAQTNVNNPQVFPTFGSSGILIPVAIVTAKSPFKERALFGNVTLHLGDATEVSGGVRRIKYTSDSRGLIINGTLNPTSQNLTDAKATIYTASVKHRLSDDLMVYASTGSSWRPPNFQIGNFTTATLSPLERLSMFAPAERSKSYEVGIKSEWFDKRLTFNLTYFHQDFKNYTYRPSTSVFYINFPTPGVAQLGQFGFVSSVPVKVNGVEGELAYRFSDRFSISNTISWSSAKVSKNGRIACTDALNNTSGAVGSDGVADLRAPTLGELQAAYGPTGEHLASCPAGGLNPSFQPKFSGSTQAEFSLPVSDSMDAYMRGLVSWRTKAKNDPQNRVDDVGAYALVNLFAGLRDPDGAWEVTGFVKNVFDTRKIVALSDTANQTGTLTGALTSRYALAGVTAPREFGVSMRVAFGSR